MEDKIINTIYELKRDVNVCKEMIERVQHHNKESIKLSFETENWKHIFRQKNEIELSKYLLIKILEKIEEEQTEMSNKNCELEFEVEKLKKENEELKEKIREHTLLISPYYVKENYISIQTIKDIVEELEENIFRIKNNIAMEEKTVILHILKI